MGPSDGSRALSTPSAAGAGATAEAILARLRTVMLDVLRPLVHAGEPVALLDYPNHSNVGDSAIWLGERAWLARLGVERLVYTNEASLYCRRTLARAVGRGTILLHGGGNFGDVWPYHQLFREKVVRDFPDNPIVVLAQSVHFRDEAQLDRAAAVFNAHRRLTLLVRDQESADRLRGRLDAPVHLCPDPALFLDLRDRRAPPVQDVLLLARTDHESAGQLREALGTLEPVDWLAEPMTLALRFADGLKWLTAQAPCRLDLLRRTLAGLYDGMAATRVARGCALLSRGRVVVTDRLHAHIICVLMGVPHVLLDNAYGKLTRFHRLWTHDVPYARFAASAAEVRKEVRALLEA